MNPDTSDGIEPNSLPHWTYANAVLSWNPCPQNFLPSIWLQSNKKKCHQCSKIGDLYQGNMLCNDRLTFHSHYLGTLLHFTEHAYTRCLIFRTRPCLHNAEQIPDGRKLVIALCTCMLIFGHFVSLPVIGLKVTWLFICSLKHWSRYSWVSRAKTANEHGSMCQRNTALGKRAFEFRAGDM